MVFCQGQRPHFTAITKITMLPFYIFWSLVFWKEDGKITGEISCKCLFSCTIIVHCFQQNQENLYLHFCWNWVRDHRSICSTLECHLGSQHLSLNSGKEHCLFQFIWGTDLWFMWSFCSLDIQVTTIPISHHEISQCGQNIWSTFCDLCLYCHTFLSRI